MPYTIECPHCEAATVPPSAAGDVACTECGERFTHLGAMPDPDWTIPIGSAVMEVSVQKPSPTQAGDVPKLTCPWCGRNVGLSSTCRRCTCDLTKTGKVLLREFVADKDPLVVGAFQQQATMIFDAPPMLCRLHRISPGLARSIGASAEVASRMNPQAPPPGAASVEVSEPEPLRRSPTTSPPSRAEGALSDRARGATAGGVVLLVSAGIPLLLYLIWSSARTRPQLVAQILQLSPIWIVVVCPLLALGAFKLASKPRG